MPKLERTLKPHFGDAPSPAIKVYVMVPSLYFVLLLLLVSSAVPLWYARDALRDTTLTSATVWTRIAWGCWVVATSCQWLLPNVPAGLQDQLWYWTAIVSLCPPMAVLGARSPTNKVWNYFILLPLLAVLGWPAMTLWAGLPEWRPVQLQAPVFVGFALVTVMGCGNYVGTRYTTSAVLLGAAIGMVLVPCATFRPDWPILNYSRELAVLCVTAALLLAGRAARQPTVAASPFDLVWVDFRDTFGLVWSVRILERLQEQGRRDKLNAIWTPDGLLWQEGDEATRAGTEQQLTQTLHWLLRRFVTPAWLDRRGVVRHEILPTPENGNRVDS